MIALLAALPAGASGDGTVRLQRWNSGDYVSLYDFYKLMDVDNSFDIITQRGKMYRKSAVAVFQIGFPVVLVNGRLERSDRPVARNNGEVMMPAELFLPVARALYPELEVTASSDSVIFARQERGPEREKKTAAKETAPKEVSPRQKERIGFIVIDAGHGGKDPGALGNGAREKNITLNVSRHLSRYLKGKVDGVALKYTRRDDRFIELSRRTEIANGLLTKNRNGMFISIHVNASLSPRISGFETYFLSQNPTNDEARTTATIENNVVVMENSSSRKKYDDVEYLEALMLTTQIQKESSMLAGEIQDSLNAGISEFKSRGVKKADFYVLRGALMPAVLVEIGYISNAKEARRLKSADYQKKIAEGIGRGVVRFIAKYNAMLKETAD
jgi:N-acetylmuramoyl-L-alanine amidase